MWEQIDEALAKEQGLAKGEAFARSVEARCGLKRPSVRPLLDPSFINSPLTLDRSQMTSPPW